MAFEAFRQFLTIDFRSGTTGKPLEVRTAVDYVSRLRRAANMLGATVEDAPPAVLRMLAADLAQDPRVIAATVPNKVVGDVAVALRAYAGFREREAPTPQPDPINAEDIVTDAEALVRVRRAQARFRAEIMAFWRGRCPLTGVETPALLRASHIKPWRDSDDQERVDPCNGLLLAVHIDALFDHALISFDESGRMLLSPRLSAHERSVFGLQPAPDPILLNARHLHYMRHHRMLFEAGGC